MPQFSPPVKVGLLGGGQLARMLALKGHELGYEMHALSPSASDPVAQVVRRHHLGDPTRRADLESFFSEVDVATFESEFLDAPLLASAAQSTKRPTPIFPDPNVMGELQDRSSQKRLLQNAGLPTLPFEEISSLQHAENYLSQNSTGIVIKQRRFGYDGYGTFHAKIKSDLHAPFTKWGNKPPPLIVEPRLSFKRELAISFSRNPRGQMIDFPLVESKQVDSRCLWVKGPTVHTKQKELTKKIRVFLQQIDYVGTIAFELFDTGKNLLINEVAPRVHNSAHYSLDALTLDQFSAHLMAVTDLDLHPPKPYNKGFAMMNLLGKTNRTPTWPALSGVRLHWYGKQINRAGRKMGHLNAVAATPAQALKLVQAAERKFTL